MVNDHNAVWGNCLSTIKENVNEQSFKTWFKPIVPLRLDNQALTIQVPNKIFYEWLEEHYVTLLKSTIRQELGEKGRLEYQIPINKLSNNSKVDSASKHSDNNAPNFMPSDGIKNPFVIPGIRKIRVEAQLNPKYLFENFIEGDCNKLARSASQAIANNPGGTAFNPLVVFGQVGLGKTHLAQAIGNEILKNFDNKNVLYVSSDKFTSQIIQAIKNNAIDDFINYYQMVDVLIVDDIQFLANRKKTQEIFFHIFNQLHQSGRQIILTSDRPPKDLDGMEERLISRFKWGLSADLVMPDFETRIAILEDKAQRGGSEVPLPVLEYLAYNIKNNIRELEGVLISLLAEADFHKKPITKELAKEVAKNFIEAENKEITISYIQDLVSEELHVSLDKMHSKTRKRSAVLARQVSMYLSKNHTNKSLKQIGETLGGRDHSTVIYSCKTIQDLIDTDMEFKKTIDDLERKLAISATTVSA